jgi:hypothetical protein
VEETADGLARPYVGVGGEPFLITDCFITFSYDNLVSRNNLNLEMLTPPLLRVKFLGKDVLLE